jgi:hypothetical protein
MSPCSRPLAPEAFYLDGRCFHRFLGQNIHLRLLSQVKTEGKDLAEQLSLAKAGTSERR